MKRFIIIFLLSLSFYSNTYAVDFPVKGWAWSSNIGWTNFNCETSTPANPVGTCSAIPWGVSIDSVSGNFKGYAWSNNIGWISFNSADTVNCPLYSCEAKVDLLTGVVSGWARALSGVGRTDGFDGWISLASTDNGANNQGKHPSAPFNQSPSGGVFFDTSTKTLKGRAWGSNVIGWFDWDATCPTCDVNAISCSLTVTEPTNGDSLIPENDVAGINFTSQNATSCTSPQFNTHGGTTGGANIAGVYSDTTFTLECFNYNLPGKSATCSATVTKSKNDDVLDPNSVPSPSPKLSVGQCLLAGGTDDLEVGDPGSEYGIYYWKIGSISGGNGGPYKYQVQNSYPPSSSGWLWSTISDITNTNSTNVAGFNSSSISSDVNLKPTVRVYDNQLRHYKEISCPRLTYDYVEPVVPQINLDLFQTSNSSAANSLKIKRGAPVLLGMDVQGYQQNECYVDGATESSWNKLFTDPNEAINGDSGLFLNKVNIENTNNPGVYNLKVRCDNTTNGPKESDQVQLTITPLIFGEQ